MNQFSKVKIQFFSQFFSQTYLKKLESQFLTILRIKIVSALSEIKNSSSLLRRCSIFLALLAALMALSSFSCSARHRWKFSTTTPTNMLSTKNPTRSRKEMK